MRKSPNLKAERFRVTSGPYASAVAADGNNGHFVVPQRAGPDLYCIVSDGAGWDHVSISVVRATGTADRLPTWEEMQSVKELFFRDDEVAVQIHPKQKHYVNNREVLHLWRSQTAPMPCPPMGLVGVPAPREPEGGDGTTVVVVDLGKEDTSRLHAYAEATGQEPDEAMSTFVQHALRVLGGTVVSQGAAPACGYEQVAE